MRVPKIHNYTNKKQGNVKHIQLSEPIIIPRLPVVTTDKQRTKLIKKIESYVRTSMEYADFTNYLRKHTNMNECTFFSNFQANNKKGMIELHHAPFDLFTITNVITKSQEIGYGYIDEFRVADEIMQCHYAGLIGIVPLSITCHELVHDKKLVVPLYCVYGRFVEFTKIYYDVINKLNDGTLELLREEMKLSKHFAEHPEELEKANSILNVQYVYVEVDGQKQIQEFKEVQKTLA